MPSHILVLSRRSTISRLRTFRAFACFTCLCTIAYLYASLCNHVLIRVFVQSRTISRLCAIAYFYVSSKPLWPTLVSSNASAFWLGHVTRSVAWALVPRRLLAARVLVPWPPPHLFVHSRTIRVLDIRVFVQLRTYTCLCAIAYYFASLCNRVPIRFEYLYARCLGSRPLGALARLRAFAYLYALSPGLSSLGRLRTFSCFAYLYALSPGLSSLGRLRLSCSPLWLWPSPSLTLGVFIGAFKSGVSFGILFLYNLCQNARFNLT